MTHLPPALKSRVKTAIRELVADPTAGKLLQNNLQAFRSYRIGTWRLIYRFDRKARQLYLYHLGPRSTVYQEAVALLPKT